MIQHNELGDVHSVTHPDSDTGLPVVEFRDAACLEGVNDCDYGCYKTGQGYL